MYVGISLFSQAVASQLFSAPPGLTSVFGMGTGGPPASSTPTFLNVLQLLIEINFVSRPKTSLIR